jgi:hypothetical protein
MDDARVQEDPAIQPTQGSGAVTPCPGVVPAQCPSCKAAAAPPQPASTSVPNQFAYVLCHAIVEQPNLGGEVWVAENEGTGFQRSFERSSSAISDRTQP